jgi:ribosomal protein L20
MAGKSAMVSLWNDELGVYVHKDCREYAALVLRKLRKKGVSIERKVVSE